MASRVIVCLVVVKRGNHWLLQSSLNQRCKIKTHQEMGNTCLGCILTCLRQFSAYISINLCLREKVEAIKYPLGMLVINPYSLVCGSWSHFLFCSGKRITCTELGIYIHPAKGVFLSNPSEAAKRLLWVFFNLMGEGRTEGFLILLFNWLKSSC